MLVPLRIPPGIYRNGTQYQSAGRWWDANLVRWRNGAMGPVGGWTKWSDTAISGIARAIQTWRDNSANRWVAVGTASKLYVYNQSGTRYDITPAGFTTGSVDATIAIGYGKSTYGSYLYGAPRPDTGTVTAATTWSLDTWGQYLVGCATSDGKLYEWQLDTGTAAAAITNAPTSCVGLVVTAERFLFALGASGNLRQIKWCDQEDNTTWTAAATNQAGDVELQTRGEIVCARRVRGATLVLTTTDAHIANYVGAPFVYQFDRVGDGCGITAPNAIAVVDNQAVWLGQKGFFVYDGYVRRLQSDVIDYFITNVSDVQISKTYAVHNSMFDEVWWFYPSDSTNECDSYISWNYVEDTWAIGSLARSAASDRVVFNRPLMVGTDGYIYEHETGLAWGSATPYAESGPFELGTGERVVSVNYLYPDETTLGDVTATFKSRMYPTATETSHGPYTLAEPTPTRLTGREFRVRVDTASPVSDWRWGVPRVDIVAGGKR